MTRVPTHPPMSNSELQMDENADTRLITVLNAAVANVEYLKDPFPYETIRLTIPIADLNKNALLFAKKHYTGFKLRWGKWEKNNFGKKDSVFFAADMTGKMEYLSHWNPLGTLFQHAFTDPLFRIMEPQKGLNDLETVTISHFRENFGYFVAKLKGFGPASAKIAFHQAKLFVHLLFAKTRGESADGSGPTQDDFRLCLENIRHLNQMRPLESDQSSFVQFHFLVLYYFAYKARSIEELERLVEGSFSFN